MATNSKWNSKEEATPIPPYTKCTAIRDFPGEHAHDLPFCVGDELTIIEPCNVIYWYLAENESGKRGVIPINFVRVHTLHQAVGNPQLSVAPPPPLPPKPNNKQPSPLPRPARSSKSLPRSGVSLQSHKPVARSSSQQPFSKNLPRDSFVDIDSRPPAPLPPEALEQHSDSPTPVRPIGRYRTQQEFVDKSGWFTRSLETVLCKKMLGCDLLALTNTKFGVYIFIHKTEERLRYVGKCRNAYQEIIQLFNRLFEKPENKLSPIEIQLKYNYPDAESWHFRLYSVSNPDMLDCEYTNKIMKHRTLQPEGLNEELKFTSKEHFYKFAEFYANIMREKFAKPNKPPHLLGNSLFQK